MMSTKEWISSIHPLNKSRKYSYKKTNYTGSMCHITITCPIHGDFVQREDNHRLAGKGCIKCSGRAHISTKEWLNSLNIDILKKGYDYSKVKYKNQKTKIDIICPIHGIFSQRPDDHKRGKGCPYCKKSGFNQSLPGIVYYLKINKGEYYKIGITNKSVKERFYASDLKKIEILKEWYFENGTDCFNMEKDILSKFKKLRVTNKINILSSGNTELFFEDVLSLDSKINS